MNLFANLITIVLGVCTFYRWMRKKAGEEKGMFSKLRLAWESDKILTLLIVLLIISYCFSMYLFYAQPSWQIITFPPKVYEPFKEAYKENEADEIKLGKPINEITKETDVYEAVHERAIAIWFKSLNRYYVLDNRNSTWTLHPDPSWETKNKWTNDRWLREHFNPPKDLGPPYSGVAKLWDRDPKNWAWIGFRVWHCHYYNSVYYQKFENGIIMGNFPLLYSSTSRTSTNICSHE